MLKFTKKPYLLNNSLVNNKLFCIIDFNKNKFCKLEGLFLTKAELTFDGDTVEDLKEDSTKSTAFSANLGAGYNFTENISAGLRYSIGLSDILDVDGYELKSNVISLSVGYKF